VDGYFYDVHPNTFAAWDAGRWAYYLGEEGRLKSKGLFGSLHILTSRGARPDTVAHELIHLLGDYLRHREATINVYNEERIAEMFDGWTRKVWREWQKREQTEAE